MANQLPPKHLYGVLGNPLAQSMSPALHTWGFSLTRHPGAYFAWEKSEEDLPAFFAAVRCLPICGLSVTIPHKQAVIPYLDGLTPRARAVGAVNLVLWRDGGLWGDNTDVAGFVAPLLARKEQGERLPPATLLMGSGGAARAALAGLAELEAPEIYVSARSNEKARALAREFGCSFLLWEDRERALADLGPVLLINATPLGMYGDLRDLTPLPSLSGLIPSRTAEASLAYDIVYNPVRTVFLADARSLNMACADGLDFFVAQGLEQFRLWTGLALPGDEARALLLHMMAGR